MIKTTPHSKVKSIRECEQVIDKLKKKHQKYKIISKRNLRSKSHYNALDKIKILNPFKSKYATHVKQIETLLPSQFKQKFWQLDTFSVQLIKSVQLIEPSKQNQVNRNLIQSASKIHQKHLQEVSKLIFKGSVNKIKEMVFVNQNFAQIPSNVKTSDSDVFSLHQKIDELCNIGITTPKDQAQKHISSLQTIEMREIQQFQHFYLE